MSDGVIFRACTVLTAAHEERQQCFGLRINLLMPGLCVYTRQRKILMGHILVIVCLYDVITASLPFMFLIDGFYAFMSARSAGYFQTEHTRFV